MNERFTEEKRMAYREGIESVRWLGWVLILEVLVWFGGVVLAFPLASLLMALTLIGHIILAWRVGNRLGTAYSDEYVRRCGRIVSLGLVVFGALAPIFNPFEGSELYLLMIGFAFSSVPLIYRLSQLLGFPLLKFSVPLCIALPPIGLVLAGIGCIIIGRIKLDDMLNFSTDYNYAKITPDVAKEFAVKDEDAYLEGWHHVQNVGIIGLTLQGVAFLLSLVVMALTDWGVGTGLLILFNGLIVVLSAFNLYFHWKAGRYLAIAYDDPPVYEYIRNVIRLVIWGSIILVLLVVVVTLNASDLEGLFRSVRTLVILYFLFVAVPAFIYMLMFYWRLYKYSGNLLIKWGVILSATVIGSFVGGILLAIEFLIEGTRRSKGYGL